MWNKQDKENRLALARWGVDGCGGVHWEAGVARCLGFSRWDSGGYDWSFQAEEGITNFALIAYTSQGYQMGLESLEARIVIREKNEAVYEEDIAFLKYDVQVKDISIKDLKNKLEEALKEKDDLKLKLKKFEESSKNLTKLINSQSVKDKTGLSYDSQMNESEVVYSVFNSRESDVDDSPVNDRFKTGKGFHAVPLPYTGNYMPLRPDLSFAGLDDSVYKTKVSETETSISKTSKDIVEKPKTVRPSAPIIEEWDTDSDNDSVFRPKSDQTKPKFTKINFVKSGENVKSVNKENTHRQVEYPRKSQSPRDNRRNWNGMMTQKLGNGFEFIKKACFVCGSFNHLIKDCDFHDNKMVEKPVLNNKGRVTGQREIRPVWNNAQRVNHQNKLTHPHPKRNFVPTAVATKSGQGFLGSGPDWLFDIDLLTNSMNYEPITAGNQTNKNAGNAIATNSGYGAHDDEDVGAEADLNNMEITMNVSPIPVTRIHNDHPKDQIIGDINSATQQGGRSKMTVEEATIAGLSAKFKTFNGNDRYKPVDKKKGFYGRFTPLFSIMMVQATEDIGADSATPTDSHSIPIITQPGRKIEDLDVDVEVTLVDETQEMNDDNLMFDTGVLEEQGIEFEKVVEEPVVSVATTTRSILIKTAKPKPVITAATTVTSVRPKAKGIIFYDQEEQVPAPIKIFSFSQSQLPQVKEKGKGKMVEPEVPLKKKDQVDLDEEMVRNLEAQLQAELIEEERLTKAIKGRRSQP
ncbi:hypothetical protein Tco_0930079 [Tanacetum coccineum]